MRLVVSVCVRMYVYVYRRAGFFRMDFFFEN